MSTFSRDAMRILCLSLAGRWWRAEWETGEFGIFTLRVVPGEGKDALRSGKHDSCVQAFGPSELSGWHVDNRQRSLIRSIAGYFS